MHNTDTSYEGVQTLTFYDFAKIVMKHSGIILLLVTFAAIASIIYALSLPDIYSSTAKIMPAQQESGGLSSLMSQMGGLAGLAGDISGRGTSSDIYSDILKSESVQNAVVERLGLLDVYGKKFKQEAVNVLKMNTNIEIGKKSGIISITTDDPEPKRAAAITSVYIEELQKLLLHLTIAGAGQSRGFLEERLVKSKGDLAKAEESLKNFQSKNMAVSVTDQAKASIEGFAQLRAQLIAQEVQLAALQRQFTDSSQDVKAAKTTVSNLKKQIAVLESGKSGGAIPSFAAMPSLGQEYVRLMRDFKMQEAIVELLTKQYEMAKLTEAKSFAPIQVIQEAKVPEIRSKPARSKIVIISIVTVFLLSIVLAFVFENISIMTDEERNRWRELVRYLPIIGKRFV